jgi:hypothetical protein
LEAEHLKANDDTFDVKEGQTAEFQPMANDVIPPGLTAVVSAVGVPAHGTAKIIGSGQRVSYTSTATGFRGDLFNVTIKDSSGTFSTSTAYANIIGQNGPDTALYAWITPPTHGNCKAACESLGKEKGWRFVNGGGGNALCAGLIDMPGVGEQWLAGELIITTLDRIMLVASAYQNGQRMA